MIGRAAVADSVFRMTGASPAGGLNMGAVALEGGHITLTDSEVRGHRDLVESLITARDDAARMRLNSLTLWDA